MLLPFCGENGLRQLDQGIGKILVRQMSGNTTNQELAQGNPIQRQPCSEGNEGKRRQGSLRLPVVELFLELAIYLV